MRLKLPMLMGAIAMLMAFAGRANAVPLNPIAYQFYETVDNTPGGAPVEFGPALPLIDSNGKSGTFYGVDNDWYLLAEPGFLPNLTDKNTWSDAVHMWWGLPDGTPLALSNAAGHFWGQMFSDPATLLVDLSSPAWTTGSQDIHTENGGQGGMSLHGVHGMGVAQDGLPYFVMIHSDMDTPEPATMLLLGMGALVITRRRRAPKRA